jgi:hypothetical protein
VCWIVYFDIICDAIHDVLMPFCRIFFHADAGIGQAVRVVRLWALQLSAIHCTAAATLRQFELGYFTPSSPPSSTQRVSSIQPQSGHGVRQACDRRSPGINA